MNLNERSKRWQLTENNHDYDKQEAVERLATLGTMVYCVAGCETGESGTKHIHIFVVFKNAIKASSLKKQFSRAHIESCKGSNASNREYVTKDDENAYEVGELPLAVSEEKNSEASEIVALMVNNGLAPVEIIREYPGYADYVVRNFRNLNDIYETLTGVISHKRKRR